MGSFNSTIFPEIQTMLRLALLCLMADVYSEAGLVAYPNGALVPYDGANIAATNAHLAYKGYLGYGYHYLGKRSAEAEADPGLVAYPNGALVPYDGANLAATQAHLATTYPRFGYHGYHYIGKRSAEAEAEADPALVAYSNGAVVPYYAPLHGGLGCWTLWLSLLGLDWRVLKLSTVQIIL